MGLGQGLNVGRIDSRYGYRLLTLTKLGGKGLTLNSEILKTFVLLLFYQQSHPSLSLIQHFLTYLVVLGKFSFLLLLKLGCDFCDLVLIFLISIFLLVKLRVGVRESLSGGRRISVQSRELLELELLKKKLKSPFYRLSHHFFQHF